MELARTPSVPFVIRFWLVRNQQPLPRYDRGGHRKSVSDRHSTCVSSVVQSPEAGQLPGRYVQTYVPDTGGNSTLTYKYRLNTVKTMKSWNKKSLGFIQQIPIKLDFLRKTTTRIHASPTGEMMLQRQSTEGCRALTRVGLPILQFCEWAKEGFAIRRTLYEKTVTIRHLEVVY